MIKTICHNCHRRAPLRRGLCKGCEKQLGHYRREVMRQETSLLAQGVMIAAPLPIIRSRRS